MRAQHQVQNVLVRIQTKNWKLKGKFNINNKGHGNLMNELNIIFMKIIIKIKTMTETQKLEKT